jgi:hypothetical protein
MATINNTDIFLVARGGAQFKQPWSQIYGNIGLPIGTVALFTQAAAPLGWTQVVTVSNAGIYLVGGAGGTVLNGGGVGFSSLYTPTYSQTVSISLSGGGISSGITSITQAQMPSHAHNYNPGYSTSINGGGQQVATPGGGLNLYAAGGNGGHAHSLGLTSTSSVVTTSDFNVKYVEAIFCQRSF